MQRVIVTVEVPGEEAAVELELPAEVDSRTLAEAICRAVRPGEPPPAQPLVIEAQPPGRRLGPEETLAGAGVWDGAWLRLIPGPK